MSERYVAMGFEHNGKPTVSRHKSVGDQGKATKKAKSPTCTFCKSGQGGGSKQDGAAANHPTDRGGAGRKYCGLGRLFDASYKSSQNG